MWRWGAPLVECDPVPSDPTIEPLRLVDVQQAVTAELDRIMTARPASSTGVRAREMNLYRRYFDRVFGYLRVVLRDRHEAEDGTQEAFLKALRALPEYERRSQPFRSWLFTIVRNHAMSLLEQSSRLEVTDTVHSLERDPVQQSSEDSVLALDWLTNSDLLVLIERLPARQRQVLVLRYLLDLSPAEVSRILETSSENVRVLQHRALTFLRERMVALGREPTHRGRIRMRGVLHKARVLRRRRFMLSG
jgi:RNA polymerase sigma-70 factor, ECF subfamily